MFDEYYRALELVEGASLADVKAAFKRLALIYHPDRPGGDAERFKKISAAYTELKKYLEDGGGGEPFKDHFSSTNYSYSTDYNGFWEHVKKASEDAERNQNNYKKRWSGDWWFNPEPESGAESFSSTKPEAPSYATPFRCPTCSRGQIIIIVVTGLAGMFSNQSPIIKCSSCDFSHVTTKL